MTVTRSNQYRDPHEIIENVYTRPAPTGPGRVSVTLTLSFDRLSQTR